MCIQWSPTRNLRTKTGSEATDQQNIPQNYNKAENVPSEQASPLDHSQKVHKHYLESLTTFCEARLGEDLLQLPRLQGDRQRFANPHLQQDLVKEGWQVLDLANMSRQQLMATVDTLAVLHSTGLAYRMSLKESLTSLHPWLVGQEVDLHTSSEAKVMVAKHLDSYLHCLSLLPGLEKVVCGLKQVQQGLFPLLSSLRRPQDSLGNRFSTICLGDLASSSLMVRGDTENPQISVLDFPSACLLSPGTDLAQLLLWQQESDTELWEEMVVAYYAKFTAVLARFGLVLRHLGTSYQHFRQEVSRALAGELLAQSLVMPILVSVVERGERRRFAGVQLLMQMRSIAEEEEEVSSRTEEVLFGLNQPQVQNQTRTLLLNIARLLKNWEVVDWLGTGDTKKGVPLRPKVSCFSGTKFSRVSRNPSSIK